MRLTENQRALLEKVHNYFMEQGDVLGQFDEYLYKDLTKDERVIYRQLHQQGFIKSERTVRVTSLGGVAILKDKLSKHLEGKRPKLSLVK